jgi:hypothetical protein
MKSATVMPASGSGADTEALIKEARRRQRRRYAATAAAVAAVLAAALGVFADIHRDGGPRSANQPSPRPATRHSARPQVPGPIPKGIDTSVLMWPVGGQAGGIYLDNMRTGRLVRAAPAVDPGEYQPIMALGRWIVYVMNNTVRATHALTGKTQVLRRAWPCLARVRLLPAQRGRSHGAIRTGGRRAAWAADHPAQGNSADRWDGRRPAAGAALWRSEWPVLAVDSGYGAKSAAAFVVGGRLRCHPSASRLWQ